MNEFKRLKLNHLSISDLDDREMNVIRGGKCGCGCYYANSGGSSSCNNDGANQQNGYTSYGGGGQPSCGSCWNSQCAESDFWRG